MLSSHPWVVIREFLAPLQMILLRAVHRDAASHPHALDAHVLPAAAIRVRSSFQAPLGVQKHLLVFELDNRLGSASSCVRIPEDDIACLHPAELASSLTLRDAS